MGNWNLRKKDITSVNYFCLVHGFCYVTSFFFFFFFPPQDSSICLLHRIFGFYCTAVLVSLLFFCMRYDFPYPCSGEKISCFLQCFSRMSSYIRSPSMSETFRCLKGKNTCKLCHSSDMQLTAAPWKKSTIESQTWFASFTICNTGEDILPMAHTSWQQSKSQRKTSGYHPRFRSKSCFGGQCFGSSPITQNLTSFAFQV